MIDESEAEKVDIAGQVAADLAKTALIFNFVINAMIGGSLELVWLMLESLQILQLTKLVNSRPTGNVSAFTRPLDEIAVGSLTEIDFLQNERYIPEQVPFSLNF